MNARLYDSTRDKHAAWRIWQEVGWIDKETEDQMDVVFSRSGRGWVADLNGEPECLVMATPGDIQYLDELLPFGCITGVTTSRLGRKQGLAGRLTAHAIAEEVASGALLCGLGMFDQGYYNQLGFGSGSYSQTIAIPVQNLLVKERARVPERLGLDDWQELHTARLSRRRTHGSSNLFPPEITLTRMHWGNHHFGLGYRDDAGGGFSHLLWCSADSVENGPYFVKYLVYRTREQFLELMAVLKTLGDQVYVVNIPEPPGVQLQDLVHQPFRAHRMSGGDHTIRNNVYAWWQMRLCDLPGCLEKTHLPWGETRFNLKLSDPIECYLDEDRPWRGVAGDYVVTLGPDSGAEPGHDATLPTLTTTVNAFTRLWLGVRPATTLAYTDDLQAPQDLLEALDATIRVPSPNPDWDW
ncbi:MAG: GNAT family N-acetyltransferase [Armatimonadia bacterium]